VGGVSATSVKADTAVADKADSTVADMADTTVADKAATTVADKADSTAVADMADTTLGYMADTAVGAMGDVNVGSSVRSGPRGDSRTGPEVLDPLKKGEGQKKVWGVLHKTGRSHPGRTFGVEEGLSWRAVGCGSSKKGAINAKASGMSWREFYRRGSLQRYTQDERRSVAFSRSMPWYVGLVSWTRL